MGNLNLFKNKEFVQTSFFHIRGYFKTSVLGGIERAVVSGGFTCSVSCNNVSRGVLGGLRQTKHGLGAASVEREWRCEHKSSSSTKN